MVTGNRHQHHTRTQRTGSCIHIETIELAMVARRQTVVLVASQICRSDRIFRLLNDGDEADTDSQVIEVQP